MVHVPVQLEVRFLFWSALGVLLIVILPHSFAKLTPYFAMQSDASFARFWWGDRRPCDRFSITELGAGGGTLVSRFEPAVSGFRIRAWIMSYAHESVPGAIGQAVLPRHPLRRLPTEIKRITASVEPKIWALRFSSTIKNGIRLVSVEPR